MGRTGNIDEVQSGRRPSIISILLITVILVILAVASVMFAYNLTKQMNTKSETQKVKDEVVEKTIAEIEKSYEPVVENPQPEVTIKTKEEIKEENGEYTEEYKKYEELTEEQKKNSEVIPRKYDIEYEEIEEIKEKQEEEKEKLKGENPEVVIEEKIPSSFDLRDKIIVETRNQGGYGLCWDFTLTKCIETNIALRTGKYYDLSEMYIDYILADEYTNGNYFRKLHDGGNGDLIKYVEGTILESDFPYGEYDVEDYRDTIENLTPFVYVNEYVEFPSDHGKTDEEIKEFRDTVKRHIMNYGSLYCSIAAPEENEEYMNGTNVYYSGDEKINGFHAVSIIGWDDNYSKDNFDCKHKPSKNGAYIAINSWGYGLQEILYISYEDTLVENGLVGIINADTKKNPRNYEKIKFEDETLYKALVSNYSYKFESWDDTTHEITMREQILNDFTNISFSNIEIKSLKGLEAFKNVSTVSMVNCGITDVSPLSNLNKITYLTLINNKIEDFSPIANLTNITNIDISGNPVKDISFLKKYSELIALTLRNCNLTDEDIKAIHGLKKMMYLGLANNDLEDLSFLSDYDNLVTLDLSGSKKIVKNLNKIPKNINCLSLNDCGLTDLDFINGFNELRALQLNSNNITQIKGLKSDILSTLDFSKNTNLEIIEIDISGSLNLDGCNISSFKQLSNVHCRTLTLSNNNIDTIDIENVDDQLYYISLENNSLKSLEGIEKFENVRNINLKNTGVEDVSQLQKLEYLSFLTLDNNPGVTGYSNLKLNDLSLKNCQLDDSTEIANAKDIRTIDVQNNEITYIDPSIFDNTNLYTLYIDDKVTNAAQLYDKSKDVGRTLRCSNIVKDVYVTVPSTEKLYLSVASVGMLSRDLIDPVNCEVNKREVIVNTQNQYNVEFSFKDNSYDSTITYIYHCTVDPYYEVNHIKPISNKITNKMIYETKEKNFEILSVKLDYGKINGLPAKSYTTNYYLNDENLDIDDEYAVISVGYDSDYVYLDIFSSEDMETIKVDDLFDFTLALETLGYNRVYSVDYDNRSFTMSPSKLNENTNIRMFRPFKNTELYKIFKNVGFISLENSGMLYIDGSFLYDFTNVRSIALDGYVPSNLKELIDRGMNISCYACMYDKYVDTAFTENLFKLEGEKLYLPIVISDFIDDEHQIDVAYVLSEKVYYNNRVDIYADYDEPTIYKEIYEYKVDENTNRLYIDGVKLDKDKSVSMFINIHGEDINQITIGFKY